MTLALTWLDEMLLGQGHYQAVEVGGVLLPARGKLSFPSGATAADNPGNDSTDVTPSGGGGSGGPDVFVTATDADGSIVSTTQRTTLLLKSLTAARVAHLPSPVGCTGLRVAVATDGTLSGAHTVTITPAAGNVVAYRAGVYGSAATLVLSGDQYYPPGCVVELVSDGANWREA